MKTKTKTIYTYKVYHSFATHNGQPGHWEKKFSGRVSGSDEMECFRKVFLKRCTWLESEGYFGERETLGEEEFERGGALSKNEFEYANEEVTFYWSIVLKKV